MEINNSFPIIFDRVQGFYVIIAGICFNRVFYITRRIVPYVTAVEGALLTVKQKIATSK
jgi:hypothetical protein